MLNIAPRQRYLKLTQILENTFYDTFAFAWIVLKKTKQSKSKLGNQLNVTILYFRKQIIIC